MKTKTSPKTILQEKFSDLFTPNFANEELVVRENTGVLTLDYQTKSNGDTWISLLKQVFLFFPGTLLLFMSSGFIFDAYFSGMVDIMFVIGGLPWILMYSFMIIIGIGDIKNPKHLAIPLSVVLVSLFIYLISTILPDSLHNKFLYEYSIYLFPLALITPFFVKNTIEESEKAK
jgi:uncharacterized membrane-anchored protein